MGKILIPNGLSSLSVGSAGAEAGTGLTNEEIARYSRHLLLREIGVDGQRKLKAAKVLIIGAGGLGSPLSLYLAAAGVGTIGLVDFDAVEASNLQRQIIHSTSGIGRPKAESARDRLRELNPHINVIAHNATLSSRNALELIGDYDIVADGTDNFRTRYLINDACVLLGKLDVYGAVSQFEGQASVFGANAGPCYRCLMPLPPSAGLAPSCAEGGVLGVLPGIIGSVQAAEVIKLIIGGAEPLIGRLLHFDAWRMTFLDLKLEKDPACPVCGENPSIRELIDYERFCGLTEEQAGKPDEAITARELKQRLDRGERIYVIDIREPREIAIVKFPNARAIPLDELVKRMDELDPSVDTALLCKTGGRGMAAIKALREAGYPGRLLNLHGGINAWARDLDRNMPFIN